MNFSIPLVFVLCSIVTAIPTPAPNDGRSLIDRVADEGKQMYSSLEKQHPNFLPYKTIFDAIEAGRVAKKLPGVNVNKDYQENVLELIENSLKYVSSSPTNISSEQVYQFAKSFISFLKQRFPGNPKISGLADQLEVVHDSNLSYGYENGATSIKNLNSLLWKISELSFSQ
ncbi:uncharacterized protein LOC107371797 [Tetranychus urticae]|uniref:Uncharacterized protein n=1 Tax=Tetranychus urticae TaxID=32264 RepID=T1JY53_TETUR|nr:uncharacterized protein LOC107371797 [Tetranychus urticae]